MEFLLAGLALAAVLQNPPTTQSGRISGVVIEEGTNLPVPGTKVSILPADEPLGPDTRRPETTSDDEGRFAFGKVTPGRARSLPRRSPQRRLRPTVRRVCLSGHRPRRSSGPR